MGVPLEVLAAIGRAVQKTGVAVVAYDDLNAAIAGLSPLFAPGYDGTSPACPPATPGPGVPASVLAAALKALTRAGVRHVHADDLNAVVAALALLCRPEAPR